MLFAVLNCPGLYCSVHFLPALPQPVPQSTCLCTASPTHLERSDGYFICLSIHFCAAKKNASSNQRDLLTCRSPVPCPYLSLSSFCLLQICPRLILPHPVLAWSLCKETVSSLHLLFTCQKHTCVLFVAQYISVTEAPQQSGAQLKCQATLQESLQLCEGKQAACMRPALP